MRLDFTILWLDDQPANVRSYSAKLENLIRRHGFKLNVRAVSSVDEAKRAVRQGVFADSLDLVLVDFDLGSRDSGDGALKAIRTKVPFRDIVFYSAKPVAELRRLAYEQGVEGVYCSGRDDLVDTAFGVFESLTKKVLDLDHSRGIVMGATSDIDNLVHEALLIAHEGMHADAQAAFLKVVLDKIRAKIDDLSKKAQKAETGTLIEVLGYVDLVTSNDKLRLAVNVISAHAGLANHKKLVSKYINEVVPLRNLLAHVRSVETDSGTVLQTRDGKKTLTEAQLNSLRVDLLEHRDNFVALVDLLKQALRK